MAKRSVARRMWVRFETYHTVTYLTPEARTAAEALGTKGGWMAYFGMRAAPLGAVGPEVVTSAFYNFAPGRVARAVPDCWAIAAPERFLQARLDGVTATLRRMAGDAVLDSPEVKEAADLAVEAASLAPTAGRPLAAANAQLKMPDVPHLALWQATATLRESRGDGHIAALITAELDPVETLVLFAADKGHPAGYFLVARGWTAEEWQAGVDRLVARGLVDTEGVLLPKGAELRAWVEERTDAAAESPWLALGEERTTRLAELLMPLARKIAEDNDFLKLNPMALRSTDLAD